MEANEIPVVGFSDRGLLLVAWKTRGYVQGWYDHITRANTPEREAFGNPKKAPILTVENYQKWYGFHLVHAPIKRAGGILGLASKPVDPNIYAEACQEARKRYGLESVEGDHVYHPAVFVEAARLLDVQLCDQSLEMVTGRWYMEGNGGLGVDTWSIHAHEPE